MSYRRSFSEAPRVMLLLSLVVALALLALACAPAQAPAAAPTQAAPVEAAPTAAPQPTQAPIAAKATTEGKYVERAGLRIFFPEGYEFGGPIIPPDPREPRYGGSFVEGIAGDPPSVDPYHTTSFQAQRHNAVVYDRVVHYTDMAGANPYNNPLIPGLAESWEVSQDFLTYTFHLRKGVKFHNLPPVNGREFDAQDLKATWDLFMDPGSVIKANFANVDRVEVIDRYTVALHMKQVEPGLLLNLSDSVRGSILPRELADPASLARRLGGIGTGPFMVATAWEYKLGNTLKRNPDYWDLDERGNRLPYLDGARIIVIPDNSARNVAFRTGKIDSGATVGGGVVGLRAWMKINPTTLVQGYAPFATGGCYCLRKDKEPWKDVRVRRALSMALDYETIAQTISGQPALVINALLSGFWHGSDDRLTTVTKECGCPWYTYDPQKAKALLAEAGFPKGFSTTLAYFPYTQSTIESAELFAAYWKAIGVDVKLLSQDYTVYRANVDSGGWENIGTSFMCCGAIGLYDVMWAVVPGGPRNPQMGFTNDPKMTALAKQVIASYADEAAQKDLARQARAYWLDQVFNIPSASGVAYIIFAPRLRNYQPVSTLLVGTNYRQYLHAWIDDDWAFNK